jgi:predicted nucleic acid-binding protein
MIYLLDSNVLSEMWKPQPDSAVVNWFFSAEWFLPSPVIAEIQEGAEASSSQARRLELNRKLDNIIKTFSPAVMDWDAETARTWGRLKHSPEVKRRPQQLWDILLDAMAVRYGATIATRNAADFRHAKTFNPWKSKYPPGEPPA